MTKAAEELGLHPITIRRWIKMSKIRAVREGIKEHIPRSEIERLLGRTDDRPLVLEARVSGHDQRPDLHTALESPFPFVAGMYKFGHGFPLFLTTIRRER